MFQRVAPVLIFTATLLTAADSPSTLPNSADLKVHEWGTFTSVAGEDGSSVDWNSLICPEGLPGFVDKFKVGPKSSLIGTVRMETPVMYFYAPRELTAHVTVQFPHGLMTEWYPKAQYSVSQNGALLPPNLNGLDHDLFKPTGISEWRDIRIQPDASPAYPVENHPSRYYAARHTDAASITVGGQQEKFLFYRGVGRFEVPLAARIMGDGKIEIENRGTDPVPGVILFENRGGRFCYRNIGTVSASASAETPALSSSFAQLQRDLEATLMGQGLFAKEAHAMVETWVDSWFEEGSRLLYVVPAHMVDTIPPVQVEPVPSQITRVFVGRIELISPATAATVQRAIEMRDGAALAPYGRFLDPILARMAGRDRKRMEALMNGLYSIAGYSRCGAATPQW